MAANQPLKMYNLNVNVATALGAGGLLGLTGLDGQGPTPRTPEILNSLIAMSSPFEGLGRARPHASPHSDDSLSGTGSPLGSPSMSPPSVQHTCSQLIKEGLKLTLQSKRKLSGSDSRDDMDDFPSKRAKSEELTAEDEERRKRRRERNKIAATKCRMKKREKTAHLVTQSQVLDAENVDLKAQISDLKKQRQDLQDMLSQHMAQHVCLHRQPSAPPAPSGPLPPPFGPLAPVPPAFDTFPQAVTPFIDPDFGDSSALISYNKDPNFGKLMDSFFPVSKVSRDKRAGALRGGYQCEDKGAGALRGGYQCEDEDPDVYRPNGSMASMGAADAAFFGGNDSGYSSFSTGSLDHSCRA